MSVSNKDAYNYVEVHLERLINSLESTQQYLLTTIQPVDSKFHQLHPMRNEQRLEEILEELKSLQYEFSQVDWAGLFAQPEHIIKICVRDHVNGMPDMMSIFERYLCLNSPVAAYLAINRASDKVDFHKTYAFEQKPLAPYNTFFITRDDSDISIMVIVDCEQTPIIGSNESEDAWLTHLTYYCQFIDEEPPALDLPDELVQHAVESAMELGLITPPPAATRATPPRSPQIPKEYYAKTDYNNTNMEG